MSDAAEFELELNGNVAQMSKKFTSELDKLEQQLLSVRRASRLVDRSFAKSTWFNQADMARHASAVVRLRQSYRSLAPASALVARGLRSIGVNGKALRGITVDAAKSEIALRRLYRLRGGGVRGGFAVARSVASRSGLAQNAGSAAWGATKMTAGALGGASFLAAGAAGAGAGMLGYNMASTAIEAERVRFALDRVTNGDGAKWWAKSSEYAAKFGMNVNMVAENLMDMKSSGFDDATVDTLFLRMGDLRALGANEETLGRAMLAIRQVSAAGRLQGDELNQLSEAGINANLIFDVLSKKLGKSRAEIMKLKEAGKLTSDIVIPAIGEAIGLKTGGGAAGEAGAAAANSTVSGLWGKLKGTWSVVSANAIQSDQLAPLRDSISRFTSWLEGSGGKSAANAFGGMLTRVFEAAPAIVERVIWFLDEGLPAAWRTFSAAFASSGGSGAISSLIQGAGRLGGEDGGNFIQFLNSAAEAAGNLSGAIVSVVDAALALANSPIAKAGMFMATAPVNAIGAVSGWLSDGGSEGEPGAANQAGMAGSTIGNSMVAGMSQSLYAGAPSVASAASFLAQSAEDAARATSETHSPSKAWERYGNDNVAGLENAFRNGIPAVQSAAIEMARVPSRSPESSQAGGFSGGITINVSIDRGQGEGRSDSELLELASEIFERKMARLVSRLAYSGAC